MLSARARFEVGYRTRTRIGAFALVGLVACSGSDNPSKPADPTPPFDPTPPGATYLQLQSVYVGLRTSCGVATNGEAYCWGSDASADLGRGTVTSSERCGVGAGTVACSTTPARVQGGPYGNVYNGGTPCALTQSGDAFCWGLNAYGERGVSTSQQVVRSPNRIPDSPAFTSLATGAQFVCGLTAAGEAYCWGGNHRGQLGNGQVSPQAGGMQHTPVPVLGGLRFTQISASDGPGSPRGFVCGVTAEGDTYCWGTNPAGQLGIGVADTLPYPQPQRVRTGVRLRSVTAGSVHACGLDAQGQAYCWGSNYAGALGRDTLKSARCNTPLYHADATGAYFYEGSCELEPIAVATSHRFRSLSAGLSRTCGVTLHGIAYCWGQLREASGAPLHTAEPVRVGGALTFRQLDAGFGNHMCGVTPTDAVYCWGPNTHGQLGNGTTQRSLEPVRVVAPR